MSANPHANGGALLRPLELPDFRDYAVPVGEPGTSSTEPTRVLGTFLRDVMSDNPDTFRVTGPDETASNRLSALFEVTDRVWQPQILDTDEHLGPHGRVMEVLSEHLCQGWLEGYLLTGRHGLFNSYEAFIHIVDAMFNQHAKWLETTRKIPWRRPIASLNYLLSSHVWRQDHNGFTHQDPGFLDVVMNKKAEVVRVYLPPDANTLLSVADHCLRSRDYVNVIVAGKQPALDWLPMDEAVLHCERGIGIWDWASTERRRRPRRRPGLRRGHPHPGDPRRRRPAPHPLPRPGRTRRQRRRPDAPPARHRTPARPDRRASTTRMFTTDRPVIFAFHGYPYLIHRLTYRRTGHHHLHVRGYREEGTTTTPFDMVMLNDLDRYHLVMDVIDRVPSLGGRVAGRPPGDGRPAAARPRVHA